MHMSGAQDLSVGELAGEAEGTPPFLHKVSTLLGPRANRIAPRGQGWLGPVHRMLELAAI